jgi:hypothetical protein
MYESTAAAENRDRAYIAALPKSSSSLMWLMVSALLEPDGRANPSKSVRGEKPFLSLTKSDIALFPIGGVCKNHAPYDYNTHQFLTVTGMKCILLLRHPADHIPGILCHTRGGLENSENLTEFVFATGPMLRSKCVVENAPEDTITHLLQDGYLFNVLKWAADWIAYSDPIQVKVMLYEEIMRNFYAQMNELSLFLRDGPISDEILEYLNSVTTSVRRQGITKGGSAKYPHGWTGEVGIWKNYLTPQHVVLYNETVYKFFYAYPLADKLLQAYPQPLTEMENGQGTQGAAVQPDRYVEA